MPSNFLFLFLTQLSNFVRLIFEADDFFLVGYYVNLEHNLYTLKFSCTSLIVMRWYNMIEHVHFPPQICEFCKVKGNLRVLL